jgi:hypothetical protein
MKFDSDPYWVQFDLSDEEWLQVLSDLEDLDFGADTMHFNLMLRSHLEKEKKRFLLNHLLYVC